MYIYIIDLAYVHFNIYQLRTINSYIICTSVWLCWNGIITISVLYYFTILLYIIHVNKYLYKLKVKIVFACNIQEYAIILSSMIDFDSINYILYFINNIFDFSLLYIFLFLYFIFIWSKSVAVKEMVMFMDIYVLGHFADIYLCFWFVYLFAYVMIKFVRILFINNRNNIVWI